jgi:hypothetical protein
MYPVNAGGTLGFLGYLISPTISEVNIEGRPTITLITNNYITINNRILF